MGLYGQRVGCFSIICDSKDEAARVESQMKLIARPMYSNPPLHGAQIVKTILSDADLKKQWYKEVRLMAERIINMRSLLRQHLEQLGSKHSWKHITDQIGMFAYSGMTGDMVDELAAKHSIYMTRNGRISMAGVNTRNVSRLAAAMHEVTK
ncbi:aspartate aminotransferase [Monoraphidium neglectum]|uniref:Aspartate aminotransferase n=1 Tax=Monoraphidium neglectum TaxID=145388 RepID=A0A0D2MN61_9CHLO|nr:aspartate aminotransferase [Monoraphidium neglectum]KIY96160.1 aspartate aminotransferase [Monoraphidium neglectum]|eukprot:XP_013895180.1 aspartate aminotransferase [Monoraphidium neglectum]